MIGRVTDGGDLIDDDGSGPRYTVAAVARRLGVAPATLRTWDRRYGLGPTAHTFGQHRRYTEADVARLQQLRRLILDGVPPAEAARSVANAPEPVQDAPEQAAQPGGGRVVPLPGSTPDVRGLARAAMALDAAAVTATLRRSFREHGVAASWHGLVAPVLQGVGERWQATGEGVEVEHLLAESVLAALRAHPPYEVPGSPQVLLAAAPDERHSLPLHVLASALAERGIPTRNLGAAVPAEALAEAVRRVGPAVLFVWSSLRTTGDPAVLEAVPTTLPGVSLVLGGPGWWLEELPPRTSFSEDLSHAVELVEQRLGL